MNNKKSVGRFGEDTAAAFLESKGLTVLCRNYYSGHNEIDIIAFAESSDTIIFVEVKTRRTKLFGTAAESVSRTKLRHLVSCAKQYMLTHPSESSVRFDVVEVYYSGSEEAYSVTEINHIENAFFDLSGLL